MGTQKSDLVEMVLLSTHTICFDLIQGSYASGKCQGNLNFFKVRELSGYFMLCQGKMNVF